MNKTNKKIIGEDKTTKQKIMECTFMPKWNVHRSEQEAKM